MQARLAVPDGLKRAIGPVRVVVEALLVLMLAIMLARFVWLLVAPQTSVASLQDRPLPTPIDEAAQTLNADRSLLVRLNPFETEFTVEATDAPETQLNLRLAGLIMSTDPFGGSAQITTPDNQTNRYILGSEVMPGVTVERILADRVILRRNGESETLMLGGRGDGLSVIGDGTQIARTVSDNTAPAPPPILEGSVASSSVLMRAVQLSPFERDGRLFGYTLSLRGAAETMAAAGFVPGDILLEINGTSVAELAVNELIHEIGDSQVAFLQVERNGTVRAVRLKFEE